MSAVNSSDELMFSVEIDFNRRLKDAVELTAKVCNSIVELALAVDVVFDWLINEAELVCVTVKMDTVDVCLSDSMVDADLMYCEHEVRINDMYIY